MQPARLVQQGIPVRLERLVQQVQPVQMVQSVQLAQQVRMGLQAQRGLLVLLDQWDPQVLPVHKDPQAQQEQQVHKDQ